MSACFRKKYRGSCVWCFLSSILRGRWGLLDKILLEPENPIARSWNRIFTGLDYIAVSRASQMCVADWVVNYEIFFFPTRSVFAVDITLISDYPPHILAVSSYLDYLWRHCIKIPATFMCAHATEMDSDVHEVLVGRQLVVFVQANIWPTAEQTGMHAHKHTYLTLSYQIWPTLMATDTWCRHVIFLPFRPDVSSSHLLLGCDFPVSSIEDDLESWYW